MTDSNDLVNNFTSHGWKCSRERTEALGFRS